MQGSGDRCSPLVPQRSTQRIVAVTRLAYRRASSADARIRTAHDIELVRAQDVSGTHVLILCITLLSVISLISISISISNDKHQSRR